MNTLIKSLICTSVFSACLNVQAGLSPTFSEPTLFESNLSAIYLALSDVNGDGNNDIISSNPLYDRIKILVGDGEGGFTSINEYPTGRNPRGLGVEDINNDGNIDIITSNAPGDIKGYISVFLGNGDGSFAEKKDVVVCENAGCDPTGRVTINDFNGDSLEDIAVSVNFGVSIVILSGDGHGDFSLSSKYGSGSGGAGGNSVVPVHGV